MIDSEDVLLVMSDRGMCAPMEHEIGGLFLLAGNGPTQGIASRIETPPEMKAAWL